MQFIRILSLLLTGTRAGLFIMVNSLVVDLLKLNGKLISKKNVVDIPTVSVGDPFWVGIPQSYSGKSTGVFFVI